MVGNRATRAAIRCPHCPSGNVRCTRLQYALRPTVVRVRSFGLPVGSPTHPPQGLFKGKRAAIDVSARSDKKCVSECWTFVTSPQSAARRSRFKVSRFRPIIRVQPRCDRPIGHPAPRSGKPSARMRQMPPPCPLAAQMYRSSHGASKAFKTVNGMPTSFHTRIRLPRPGC